MQPFQWFSARGDFSPHASSLAFWTFLCVAVRGGGATEFCWVEARDAAKHLTMHGTVPYRKEYAALNVNSKERKQSGVILMSLRTWLGRTGRLSPSWGKAGKEKEQEEKIMKEIEAPGYGKAEWAENQEQWNQPQFVFIVVVFCRHSVSPFPQHKTHEVLMWLAHKNAFNNVMS